MTNLDSILKSRDITLSTKAHLVKAMVFPVVMYACESWTIKKAVHRRIDAFELWCWRRILRVSWTVGDPTSPSSKKSVLNSHSKNWCWRWNSNTLATLCKELTPWKRLWFWERLKAGGEGDDRGWDVRMASLTWWTWVWVNFGSWWWTGKPVMLQSMGSQGDGYDWATDLNWTDCPKLWMQEGASAQLSQDPWTCCAFFQDISPDNLRAPVSPHLKQFHPPPLLFLQSTCHTLMVHFLYSFSVLLLVQKIVCFLVLRYRSNEWHLNKPLLIEWMKVGLCHICIYLGMYLLWTQPLYRIILHWPKSSFGFFFKNTMLWKILYNLSDLPNK